MRNPRIGLVIGLLGVLLVAPTASAAAPPTTTIQIDIVFEVSEDFTTTGGVLCPSGTAVTEPVFAAGFGRMGRGAGSFHLDQDPDLRRRLRNVPDQGQRRPDCRPAPREASRSSVAPVPTRA